MVQFTVTEDCKTHRVYDGIQPLAPENFSRGLVAIVMQEGEFELWHLSEIAAVHELHRYYRTEQEPNAPYDIRVVR